jgi:hypothetical protein
MPGSKLGLFVLVFILVAPVVVSAYSCDNSSSSSDASWMDRMTVFQLFDNPSDYKWQGAWDPRYDSDWQRHYGRDYDSAGGAVCRCGP